MELISNTFFIAGSMVLIFAILSFELGLRAMKNDEKEKMKGHNRRGWKAMLICGLMYVLSFIIALFV
ncbi:MULTISPECIES: hypothetical protein [Pseudothermotoga]|uniref:hypothetical protein n=1 Tax=Pseudothermotoga TaxID=1643951 RepID=UPI0003263E97|nr:MULTISPECIES: hypothetical protein [Pseudothermotoga]HBJ81558.1 hypothetical protein [Pseudothermotoga sp.]